MLLKMPIVSTVDLHLGYWGNTERLSRAQRVTENAFGILSNRFRVLDKHIYLSPEKSSKVTNACIVLQNFLLTRNDVRCNNRKTDSGAGIMQRIGQQGGTVTTPKRETSETSSVTISTPIEQWSGNGPFPCRVCNGSRYYVAYVGRCYVRGEGCSLL